MPQLEMVSRKGDLINELSTVSDSMKEYLCTEDDAVLTSITTYMNREPNFWRKLFPNAFDKERGKIALDSFRTAYGHRRALITAFAETQIEIAKRRGDALLVAVAVDLQTKLATFASYKLRELEKTLIATKDDFLELADEHWENVEKYRGKPELYGAARQDCVQEIRAILTCIQSLRENFTTALQAKVAFAGKEQ